MCIILARLIFCIFTERINSVYLFLIGNENLYLFTHQDLYELRVDLSDFEGHAAFSKYGAFAVGSEKEKYMLKLLGPITGGDAGKCIYGLLLEKVQVYYLLRVGAQVGRTVRRGSYIVEICEVSDILLLLVFNLTYSKL